MCRMQILIENEEDNLSPVSTTGNHLRSTAFTKSSHTRVEDKESSTDGIDSSGGNKINVLERQRSMTRKKKEEAEIHNLKKVKFSLFCQFSTTIVAATFWFLGGLLWMLWSFRSPFLSYIAALIVQGSEILLFCLLSLYVFRTQRAKVVAAQEAEGKKRKATHVSVKSTKVKAVKLGESIKEDDLGTPQISPESRISTNLQ